MSDQEARSAAQGHRNTPEQNQEAINHYGRCETCGATRAASGARGERRRIAYLWRWPKRLRCHGSVMPCQYTDDPNDNHA